MLHACMQAYSSSMEGLTVVGIVPQGRYLRGRVEDVHVQHHEQIVLGGLVQEGVEAVEVVEALDGGVDRLGVCMWRIMRSAIIQPF